MSKDTALKVTEVATAHDYLVVHIADQIFGIPVMQIQDVLRHMAFTRVPLAPAEVAGALNLRGRIVTAINVRKKLGLSVEDMPENPMSVVVEHDHELYSLMIDKVADVISIEETQIKETPPTLDDLWRDISNGIYKMDGRLLLLMDVSKLLGAVS